MLFPDIVYADTSRDVLHTTSSFVNVGLQNKNQMEDAPTFAELIGRKSFFLTYTWYRSNSWYESLI